MERVQVDLPGPHPPVNGFTYICTCICAFTKYVVAWPIRNKKWAPTVAKDIVLGNPNGPPQSVNDYAAHLTGAMAEAYDEVRKHLQRSAERNKQYYDFSANPVEFQPGDQVWVYSPRHYRNRSQKWSRCYSGPFEVIRRVNAVNYVVRRTPQAAPAIVHVNKLKPYRSPDLKFQGKDSD